MQWYFLSDTQEQIPVQEDHLAGLVQTGVIRPNTMIWHEGMDGWVACSETKPELFAHRHVVPVLGAAATARQTAALQPQAASPENSPRTAPGGMQLGDGHMVREAAAAFASAAVWMKVIGMLFLVGGVAYILMALFLMVTGVSMEGGLIPALIVSLITAAVGAIVMWMGILLFQSASKAQEAAITAQKHALLSALDQNAKFFKIWGITVALAALCYGLIFAAAISGVMGGALLNHLGAPGEIEMLQSPQQDFDSVDSDNESAEGTLIEVQAPAIVDEEEREREESN